MFEYILRLLVTVLRSPLPLGTRIRCLGAFLRWLLTHVVPGRATKALEKTEPALFTGTAASRRRTVRRNAAP